MKLHAQVKSPSGLLPTLCKQSGAGRGDAVWQLSGGRVSAANYC